jgi:hypothetical protein
MKLLFGVSISAILAIAMGIAAIAMVPATPVSIDAVSLKFLPPETQGIAFIDVASLRNAPLLQDGLKQKDLQVPGDWADFVSATGIDPERDIDRVTIGKIDARNALFVVQGRIDRFKIGQYLKEKGKLGTSEAYLGQTLYRDRDNACVFLDNVVLAGQVGAVKKALDQMQLPGSLPLRSDLISAIQTIEAGNQVWAAGDFSASDLGSVGVRGPAPAVEMLKSLRSGTYQMRIDSGLVARATGNFADAESAKNVGDLGRGALALAKVQFARQQPQMAQLLDGIQVSYSGTTVTVRIEESEEALKKLKDLRPAIERQIR